MGTLKTSINISSTDTLPFSYNRTVKETVEAGAFVESGVKVVQQLTSASFAAKEGLLSSRQCGGNGAYVFVENPETSIGNVYLYGRTDVEAAVEAAGGDFALITGLEALAVLKPGAAVMLPLSPTQQGVFAHTDSGQVTVQYNITDRDGAFGQSVLVVSAGPSTYRYAVLDAQAGVLTNGNPTPHFTSLDTEIPVAYSFVQTNITNNKGYTLKFVDDQNPDHVFHKHISSKGQIYTVETSGSILTDELEQMRGHVIAYTNVEDELAVINVFDGEELYTHNISGSFDNFITDWDDCTSDGAFIVTVNDYLGGTGDTATILVNKGNYYVLYVAGSGEAEQVVTAAAYYFGTFVMVLREDTDQGIYTRFQIWNTDGALLKDLDIEDFAFDLTDYVYYGTNKLQIIFKNDTVYDYLLNYNGATNRLIGHNATNHQLPLINWTVDRSIGYDERTIYGFAKDTTPNSIGSFDDNDGVFDAESVAIIYSDFVDNENNFFINSAVDHCQVEYVLNGATTHNTYEFTSGPTKYIRIPGTGLSSTVAPTSNHIALTYGQIGYDTGSLGMISITPTGVISSSIATKLEDLDNDFNDIIAVPVGEYTLYKTYNNVTDKTTFTMAKTAAVKATLVISGDTAQYTRKYNSLLVWDDGLEKIWFFNTVTNTFKELTNTWSWWNSSTFRYNLSTTDSGIVDGNILLQPATIDPQQPTLAKMRLFKRGTLTPVRQVPVTDGESFFRLGSEAVFYIYQDMNDNLNWTVNVYDLDLNLKKTIPLGTPNYDQLQVAGKRLFAKTYDVDQLLGGNYYSYYVISLESVAYWLHADDDPFYINDKYYFND